MRLLMPYPTDPAVRGPMPKVTPYLIGGLRALGVTVDMAHWGRRRDDETWWQKIGMRAGDVARITALAARRRHDAVVIATAHDRVAVARDLPLALAVRPFARRLILHLHGSRPDEIVPPRGGWFRWATRLLFALVDGALVLSREEQRQWQRALPGTHVAVVQNPFVAEEHRPGPAASPPSAWALPPDRPVLLFVGRLIEEKGIFDLLDAVARLPADCPWHLLVLGDGAEAAAVRSRATTSPLRGRVTLAGYVRGVELEAAYGAATALVLPTFWAEGFPTVVAEAMSAGLPVVTTRIRGVADYLTEANAVFVPAHDPKALAGALAVLLRDPERRVRMGTANRALIGQFAPEPSARRFRAALRTLGVHG